jgi:8-hydroxy-5-deazaflavin:NADPH oxidoreductase
MEIAVIGAGRIGGNVAERFARAGHAVTVAFSRDESNLRALADRIGARVAAPEAAVRAAELVVVSVPWGVLPEALERIGRWAERS